MGQYFGVIFHQKSILFRVMNRLCHQYLGDIKTLPNIICALSLFLYFITMPKKQNLFVQKIASVSFSVYVVHQVPSFFHFLWYEIFRCEAFRSKSWSGLYLIIVAIAVYVAVYVLDTVIRMRIEKKWITTTLFKKAANALTHMYDQVQIINLGNDKEI
jgi:hypothetical protein